MAKSLQLNYAIRAYLLLTWSAMAYAAESPLVVGIEAIPPRALVYVFGLAIIGGAAGTLTKLSRPDVVVRSLPLEICKDILASIVAGMMSFFIASWFNKLDFWAMAASITMAGYGGSKLLDFALVEGVMPMLRDFFRRVFNVASPATPPKDGPP